MNSHAYGYPVTHYAHSRRSKHNTDSTNREFQLAFTPWNTDPYPCCCCASPNPSNPRRQNARRKRWERWFDKIDFLISSLITAARSLALAAATIFIPVLIDTYCRSSSATMLWPRKCLDNSIIGDWPKDLRVHNTETSGEQQAGCLVLCSDIAWTAVAFRAMLHSPTASLDGNH